MFFFSFFMFEVQLQIAATETRNEIYLGHFYVALYKAGN